ncbi:MAG: TlpA family protein disulfide reductase [Bacteroidetes bacterium]|nr:TlpA family protein disulfide reductase [Bacteroidota bacterium]
MKLISYFFATCILFFAACSSNSTKNEDKKPELLVEGIWHLDFLLSPNNILPVEFSLNKVDTVFEIEFLNAEEKITIKDVKVDGDKITIKDEIFNTWFEGKIVSPTKITGFWYKENVTYKIPFEAEQGIKERFPEPENLSNHQSNITGKWEVDFSKGTDDHYKAIGQFQQVDNYVTGTFMTETGDYRFLEGNMYNNNLYLSCFDGAHSFLFKASLINDVLEGNFWSGTHWEEPFVAIRNENFELTNPDSLTFLKQGFETIDFKLPNVDGETVSLTDEKYQNKVVIVNVMGPWCPNCKDETTYLTELYNKYHIEGLEIVALSFDKTDDFETSKNNILKVKNHFKVDYDFLIAGKASKIEAAKVLPMLNQIMSYPTSIFIDKKGKVRKIRTGFYGPGTGNYYKRYTDETTIFIQTLLKEK